MYVNALDNPFVYDDHHTVVENASIAHIADLRVIVLGAITRPLVNLSYAVDRAIWGPKPFGFHLGNVLMHTLNVVVIFLLARRLGHGEPGAFGAAVLFAVHPMLSEAVGYISGRSEVLCATFFMPALMCGSRWLRGDGAKWAASTIGLWVAAMASKESAAMFPFVFLLYDWLVEAAAGRRRRMLTIHLPLVAAAVIAGIVRLLILTRLEYPGQVAVHWDYVLLELDVARRYLWMMLNPMGQTIFHAVPAVGLFSWRAFAAIAAVGGAVVLSWRLRETVPAASFGLLWFLLALVPSAALIVLDQGEPMAEHRVYLASCGFFLAAGAGIDRVHGRARRYRRAVGGFGPSSATYPVLPASALALVVVSLSAMTIVRNAVFSDPVMLWQESVNFAPTHYRPRLLLGEALQDAGRRTEALAQYQAAIQLRPTEPLGYVKVGQCLAEVGQWREAREHFLRAIELDPHNRFARNSLAVLDHVESRFGNDDSRR